MVFQCPVNQILICLHVLLFSVFNVVVDAIACTRASQSRVSALDARLYLIIQLAPDPPALECLPQCAGCRARSPPADRDCLSRVLISFHAPDSAAVPTPFRRNLRENLRRSTYDVLVSMHVGLSSSFSPVPVNQILICPQVFVFVFLFL